MGGGQGLKSGHGGSRIGDATRETTETMPIGVSSRTTTRATTEPATRTDATSRPTARTTTRERTAAASRRGMIDAMPHALRMWTTSLTGSVASTLTAECPSCERPTFAISAARHSLDRRYLDDCDVTTLRHVCVGVSLARSLRNLQPI